MQINPSISIENCGGKGYQLFLLKKICPVPDFFILCFDAESEIDSHNVQWEILKAFDSYGFEYVSVRSSATMEDSKTASFAGMFETELNIKRDGLINAIRSVLISLKDERVVSYCKLNQLDFRTIQMRIVVQKMINSKVSGVCITKPQKKSETLLLEACLGLGEALVGGVVTPDTYKINRFTLAVESEFIGYQKSMIPAFGKNTYMPVPFYQRNSKKLQKPEIFEIVKWCMNIEKQLGYESADVEWAYEESTLYILQARPFVGLI